MFDDAEIYRFVSEVLPSTLITDLKPCPYPYFAFKSKRYHQEHPAVGVILDNNWQPVSSKYPRTVIALTKEDQPYAYMNVCKCDGDTIFHWDGFSLNPGFVHGKPMAYVPPRYKRIAESMLQLYAALFESNE